MSNSLLIKHTNEPYWASSKLIRNGICKIWVESSLKIKALKIDFYNPKWDKKIVGLHFKKLVFCESYPHPGLLLAPDLPFTFDELVFHVYGNFTQLLPEWLELLTSLKGKKVSIVVASRAEMALLTNLLGKSLEKNIHILPYPFQRLGTAKNSFDLKKDGKWIVYAGRLSLQKNIGTLLDCLERFFFDEPRLLSQSKILIAGDFDSISLPFRKNMQPGAFFQALQKRLDKLPTTLRDRLIFCGQLNQPELHRLFSLADVTISLSTFHDEDFGYAILQALGEGSPVIVTEWGGFQDFRAHYPGSVYGVKINSTDKGMCLSFSDFKNSLKRIYSSKNDNTQREKLKKSILKKYSIKSLSQEVQKLKGEKINLKIQKKAKEFSRRLVAFREGKKYVFKSFSGDDNFYESIYHPYYDSKERIP